MILFQGIFKMKNKLVTQNMHNMIIMILIIIFLQRKNIIWLRLRQVMANLWFHFLDLLHMSINNGDMGILELELYNNVKNQFYVSDIKKNMYSSSSIGVLLIFANAS